MQNYSGSVPAVQRTIAVLEHLRGGDNAPTLTELSQELALNRSSLLAILNTLRGAGYVSRDEADRYHLGPGLLGFASSVARATGPVEAFDRPAQWLVDALGESVALVRLSPQGAVCVAFKMGRHGVRAVVELGQISSLPRSAGGLAVLAALDEPEVERLAWSVSPGLLAERLAEVRKCGCAYVEDGGELGQAALAAPVCDSDGRPVAAIEVVAPAYRLAGEDLREAGRLVITAARQASLALGCWSYAPYDRPSRRGEQWRDKGVASLHGSELDAFLAHPWVASLACLRENGYPYTVPVWYEWRAGAFWLTARPGARWAGYVRQHPQVSMTVSEPGPPFRRVHVEGRASVVLKPDASQRDLERRLAQRYLGPYAAGYLETGAGGPRPPIKLTPDSMSSSQGLMARGPGVGSQGPAKDQEIATGSLARLGPGPRSLAPGRERATR